MFDSISKVEDELASVQKRFITKLNEFVDHFGKLHETLDDHEHCLRHHAEEIENRTTKYDLFICRNQIDKCALQETFLREVGELKKMLSWHSTKLESLGLGAQAAGGRKRTKNKRPQMYSKTPKGQGRKLSIMR